MSKKQQAKPTNGTNKTPNPTGAESAQREVYRLSDDIIAVIRELVQLTLMTGTNVVDHMRAVRVEILQGAVVPTVEYIESYNAYIRKLEEIIKQRQAEQEKQTADR
jgi:hypothetical protein